MYKKRSQSTVRYKTQMNEDRYVGQLPAYQQNITDRVPFKSKVDFKNQPLTVSVWQQPTSSQDYNKQNVYNQNCYHSKKSAPLKHPKDIFFKAAIVKQSKNNHKDKTQTQNQNDHQISCFIDNTFNEQTNNKLFDKQERYSLQPNRLSKKNLRIVTTQDEPEKKLSHTNIKISQQIKSQHNYQTSVNKGKDQLIHILQKKCKQYQAQLLKFYEYQTIKIESKDKNNDKFSLTTSFLNDSQNHQKNIYIKQINSKNTQINNLTEQISLLKREQQTLRNYIQQQQKQIKQQQGKLLNYDSQKQKINKYEIQSQSNQNILKDIQNQMIKIKQEQKKKDNIIAENNFKVNQMVQQIKDYQEKLIKLEEQTLTFKSSLSKSKQDNKFLQEQISHLKQKYLIEKSLKEKNQKIVKQKDSTIDLMNRNFSQDKQEYQSKIKHLNQEYQKDKNSLQKKIFHSEKQITDLKKQVKNKIDTIEKLEIQFSQYMMNNSNKSQLSNQINALNNKIKINQKKIRNCQNEISQKSILIQTLNQGIQDLKAENQTLLSKLQNSDSIIKENHQLTNTVLSKITIIQQLQNTINILQNKLELSQKEYSKMKLQKQSKQNIIDDYLNSMKLIQEKVKQQSSKMNNLLKQISQLKEEGQQKQQENQILVKTIDQQKYLLSELIEGINRVNQQMILTKKQVSNLQEQSFLNKDKILKLQVSIKLLTEQLQREKQNNNKTYQYAEKIKIMAKNIQMLYNSKNSPKKPFQENQL